LVVVVACFVEKFIGSTATWTERAVAVGDSLYLLYARGKVGVALGSRWHHCDPSAREEVQT
jgi:hypothetical protein